MTRAPPPAPDPCGADFVGHTRRLFVDVAQRRAIATGKRPARRAVFRKLHGVAHGRLELDPSRPEWTRHGVFAGERYACWVRFSGDVAPTADDVDNGTVGLAVKLFGVTGPTLAENDPGAPTADLVLQNHDVFFVDTGEDMCRFTDLSLAGREDEWNAAHPDTPRILAEMQKHERSLLAATYWSVLPYACGPERTAKYRVRGQVAADEAASGPDRLRSDLAARLKAADARFALELQSPPADEPLPLDRATVRWTDEAAPWTRLGELVLPQQDVNAEGQEAYGEALAFSPWRVPEANRPLGSIALSRRGAYPASAALRRHVNGVPDAEPHAPREP